MSLNSIADQTPTAEGLPETLRNRLPTSPSAENATAMGGGSDWGLRAQDALMRIPVSVRIVLGATKMPLSKLMGLSRGSIIPLDRKVGDLVDIMVNDRLVARGEVVVLDGDAERFAVAVREVVRTSES